MSADVLSHVRVVPAPPVRIPSPTAVLSSAALAFEEAQLRADSRECDENNCPCRDADPDVWPWGHYCERCYACAENLAGRLMAAQDDLVAAVVAAGLSDAVAEAAKPEPGTDEAAQRAVAANPDRIIAAIRDLRAETGCTLRESKDRIDAMWPA